METTSTVHFHSATSMEELADESVQLVVTSPPYPMIEMWDDVFAAWDQQIGDSLDRDRFDDAFDQMHACLAEVWKECFRILQEGGLLCVNIGDATRSEQGSFRLYHNHARTLETCVKAGFDPMPGILWRKTTNKPTKFMGSGMIAPNAYVTLEHEHILIFRKGDKRVIRKPKRKSRYESAFFWEERNRWFSDVWTDLRGVRQPLSADSESQRERSAAFPLTLPLRLIHMFSVYDDTVVDPFWGTGTTSLAAMLLRRNAVGYEVDVSFWDVFTNLLDEVPSESAEYAASRLDRHQDFLASYSGTPSYRNDWYDLPVVTRQETSIRMYELTGVVHQSKHRVHCDYQPFDGRS